jgi:hypothetical protein
MSVTDWVVMLLVVLGLLIAVTVNSHCGKMPITEVIFTTVCICTVFDLKRRDQNHRLKIFRRAIGRALVFDDDTCMVRVSFLTQKRKAYYSASSSSLQSLLCRY